MNLKKLIIIAAIVIVAIIVGLAIFFSLPKTQAHLAVAPLEVQLSIDGEPSKTVRNGQDITVSPGEHTLSFSRDEFSPYVKKYTFKENEKTEVLVALEPLTPKAEELLLEPEAEVVVQLFKGDEFKAIEEETDKSFPIMDVLPIQARLYMVTSCQSKKYPDDKTKLALCAYMYHAGLEPYIKKHIKNLGYDPNDYEIIWIKRYEDG